MNDFAGSIDSIRQSVQRQRRSIATADDLEMIREVSCHQADLIDGLLSHASELLTEYQRDRAELKSKLGDQEFLSVPREKLIYLDCQALLVLVEVERAAEAGQAPPGIVTQFAKLARMTSALRANAERVQIT